jgi:hypothetical protein
MRSRAALQGESRLARAARSRERQEPCCGQPSLDLDHLALAAHEAAPRGWQVGARGLTCSTGAQSTLSGCPAARLVEGLRPRVTAVG